jgi:hypothetical protein
MERSEGDPKKENREKNNEDLFHTYSAASVPEIFGL